MHKSCATLNAESLYSPHSKTIVNMAWDNTNINQFQDVTNVIPGSIGPIKYYTKNKTPYHYGTGDEAPAGGTKVAADNDMID